MTWRERACRSDISTALMARPSYIAAVAGLYPSMRAAQLSPTEALRTV